MKVEGAPIVAVLGAINVDLVVSGAPLPGPGQTVTGGVFAQHHGGKGGNQAVAAARALSLSDERMFHRAGDPWTGVWMLGAVGDDDLGARRAGGAPRRTASRPITSSSHRTRRPGSRSSRSASTARTRSRSRPARTRRSSPSDVVGALETLEPHVRAREPRGSRADGASRAAVGTRPRRDHDPQPRAAAAVGARPARARDVRHPQRARAFDARRDPRGCRRHRDPRTRRGGDPPARRVGGAGPRAERPGGRHDRRRRLLQRRARGRPRDGHRAHRRPCATRSWPPPSPSAPPAPARACPTSQAISEARERFGS